MKRREFIKISSLTTGSILTSSSIVGLITSVSGCSKDHHIGLITKPVMVTEGDFLRSLSYPLEVGTNHSLAAQTTSANINGANITVLGYQPNKVLGPTFRVNKGDVMNVLLQNNLSEHTNIHWHGLKVPAIMDGHPDQVIYTNSNYRYQFTLNQRAGLCWYHPHTHGNTGKQVFQGLAGAFIINDAEETALNLPSGQFEIPLIIQDKRILNNGIPYNPSMTEIMAGYMGESILVNGVHSPSIEVATRYYRLRILNGSNARIYNLALSNNDNLIIIGNDGGLLKTPVTTKDILIAPGERLDILVNFSAVALGSEIFLLSKEFENGGNAQGKQSFKIMKFKIVVSYTNNFIVPTTLSSINTLSTSSSSKTRTFDISNAMEHHGYAMNDGMQMRHRINGILFDSNRVDESVAANAIETWVFDNSKGDEPHPMHIHGVFFQVISRIGGRGNLTGSENGWKDTVLVMAEEKVSVIIKFENNLGKYVFHCHNLEHEDDGMMLQYQIS